MIWHICVYDLGRCKEIPIHQTVRCLQRPCHASIVPRRHPPCKITGGGVFHVSWGHHFKSAWLLVAWMIGKIHTQNDQVLISSQVGWAEHDLTRKTSLNRYICGFDLQIHTNSTGFLYELRGFSNPMGFPVAICWEFPSTRCTAIAPARVCLDREEHHGTIAPHTSSHLARPPRRQRSNQPTNGNSVTHRWQVGGTYDMTFPYQIPVTACWLHTWWRILVNAAVDDLMIWCVFFWRQKGWIQQVEGFKCGIRVLGQMAALSMGVQIGISRDCGIHRLLALPSLTNATHITFAEEILA